jgi:uncharacterized repeat protein (TIGR03803 family)
MARKTLLIVVTFAALILAPNTWAKSGKEYKFSGGARDGANPQGGLVTDGMGNFYGTTYGGGLNHCGYGGNGDLPCGTVFKVALGQDGSWKKSTIYSFKGGDGANPSAGLTLDTAGNLYGTTSGGGDFGRCSLGCGTVFRLSPTQQGSWAESIIYTFEAHADGYVPQSGVIFDNAGNLYGTTSVGGCSPSCYGAVFELTPSLSGEWTEATLYTFLGGQDGNNSSGVVLDAAGNLYGTTSRGGNIQNGGPCGDQGCGTVFELTPSQNGSWTKTVLYSFNFGLDGAYPSSGVTFDSAGDLYGESAEGGSLACPGSGCGVVYELTPESGAWKFDVAQTFNGLNGTKGKEPAGGLVFDDAGNMYGTTVGGGDAACYAGAGCGTIFKLSPKAGGRFTFIMIGAFNNTDGANPAAGVIVDSAGTLYGTTYNGGNPNCAPAGCGVVFTITP